MKSITIRRGQEIFELPVLYFKEVQSTSSNRDSFGAVYSAVSEHLEIFFKSNVDIRKGDLLLYNDYELEVGSVVSVQYKGKKFLKKAVVMI